MSSALGPSIIELGSGPTLVLIPGVQGAWEFARPAVEALAKSFHVLTFSLGAEGAIDADAARIVQVLDHRRLDQAIVCGISFGGLVALRFAATHPARARALVLASTPGPGTHLRPHHQVYARWPYVFGPLFFVETPLRLRRELARTLPRLADRCAFGWSQFKALLAGGLSLPQIARRALSMEHLDIAGDCGRVTVPTLVVTGEPALDEIVPVSGSKEYVRLIRGARYVVLERTGHLGTITHPAAFATAVNGFVEDAVARPRQGRERPEVA